MTRMLVLIIGVLSLNSCSRERENSAYRELRLATTTSTRDSGLLDRLIPEFESQTGSVVRVIAVGTGKALELGRLGEVDVLLVHAEQAELEFMRGGHGTFRQPVMFNRFEILGPSSDPAGIRNKSPLDALRKIRSSGACFVSRGDDSGTHKKEKWLWEQSGLNPDWGRYLESGQGMGATLIVANEKNAYTLCDRGTYLSMRSRIDLVPLAAPDSNLINPYSVIRIDPAKNRWIRGDLARQFTEFMVAPATRSLINDFRIDGEPLFQAFEPVVKPSKPNPETIAERP